MKIRRICVYGGPGSGKTTIYHWLTSELSIAGYLIQGIDETAKLWACEGRVPDKWDQIHFLSDHIQREKRFLDSGKADLLATDCPLLIMGAYALRNEFPIADEVISIAKKFDGDYPGIHLFCDRTGIPYRQGGRFETYEQAVATDTIIEEVMKKHLPSYQKVRTKDRNEILKMILQQLKGESYG